MRWFKHISNARNDPFVRELMYQFGSDGYVAWFGTIEIIAEDLEAKDIRACGKNVETLVKEHPRFFAEQLVIPVEKLKRIYLHIKSRGRGRFTERAGRWTVDIPKVLEFMDEWTERILREAQNTREKLPSDSGKNRTEESRVEEKELRIAGLRKGTGGPGAGGLAFLADEFAKVTGNSAFGRIRNVQRVIDTLGPLIQLRGVDPCVAVMKERIDGAKKAGTKIPSNLSYFIPVFKDDSAFKNGHARPAEVPQEPAKRAGGTASMSDLTRGIIPKAEGRQED